MHSVRLVVLGAPSVGKTALVEVLVAHAVQPLRSRARADEPHVYSLTTLLDGLVYCVSLLDSPPPDCHKLLTADAYLLLFDLSSPGQSRCRPAACHLR